MIHRRAKRCKTDAAKKEFIEDIKQLSEEFPCTKCRKHMQEHLKVSPFEPYMNIKNEKGDHIGMFKWTWDFHNAVNTRLGKPYVDFNTAWNLTEDTGFAFCTQGCEESEPITDKDNVKMMSQTALNGKVTPQLLKNLSPALFY